MSVLCRLQAQESKVVWFLLNQRSDNLGTQSCESQCESEWQRTKSTDVPRQEKRGVLLLREPVHSPSASVFCWALRVLGDAHHFFTQSTSSNANLCQKQPHRHTQK